MTCPELLRKLLCRKVQCKNMDEIIYVETLGPNGREMIPVSTRTEAPSETTVAESEVAEPEVKEAPKRTRKKKTSE